jgi:hypothetical protein
VVNSGTGRVIYSPPTPVEVSVSGIARFQFVYIHPFLDGNNRTSRLAHSVLTGSPAIVLDLNAPLNEFRDVDIAGLAAQRIVIKPE